MRVDLTGQNHTVSVDMTITHAYHTVNGVEVKHEFQNAINLVAGQTIGFADNIHAFERV